LLRAQVTVAEVVHAVQPDMKFAVIVREPAARMYSAFWYYGCMYGIHGDTLTPEKFHETAKREVDAVRKCISGGATMRQCARELFHVAQQLVKGMYAAFAPDWLAAFPREQVMWIRAEDYYADDRKHLQVRRSRPVHCARRPMHGLRAGCTRCVLTVNVHPIFWSSCTIVTRLVRYAVHDVAGNCQVAGAARAR
jgi:hypothetical protein